MHEVGHVVDILTKDIPTDGLQKELDRIYSLGSTGKFDRRTPFTPGDAGYKPDEFREEYMAEALRFYMADPAWMKANAPKTARRIREWVNENESLKAVIQFNSIAAAIGLPLMLRDDEDDGS